MKGWFLGEPGLPRKIVWGVIAALFGVITIIALSASLFLILGLNDNGKTVFYAD